MVRRRWIFFGPRIERERNIDEYLDEIRRTPSTVERETKRSLKPGWKLDTPLPVTEDEPKPPEDEPKGGHHRAESIIKVEADYHPMWNELPETAKALWNLRFLGHARYTVPLGRLADYLRRVRDEELSNWGWLSVDFIDWPEHWKTS